MHSKLRILEQPPAGWFALDVMKAGKDARKWDWCALMVDVHPDQLKHCLCEFAFLYVHPNEYRPDENRIAQEAWLSIPGKHRTKEAAWEVLQKMLAKRLN